ncbi:MMPL family transporter [Actinomadura sp. WMMB 499]|uniref:MMPL family transporter n=1 Tax=Actinomadura sp. WMMB 499 TaxID=1219491 RepID=UPI0012479A5C|nr:MMPL family transporter [Actinomadura sp. WMMB 499]QFG24195.1 MMPL family transporter [Actinomadura sp. WMMB 499]
MSTLLYRLGRFGHRRRRLVALLWLAVALAAGTAAATLSGPAVTSFSLPGTESQEALDLLDERFPGTPMDGASARIVFASRDGAPVDGDRRAIEGILRDLATGAQVQEVIGPFEAGLLSPDRTMALAEVSYEVGFPEMAEESKEALHEAARAGERAGLTVELGGDALEPEWAVGGELAGLVVAAVVLVLTLGSLLAAGMPLLTGITGVIVGVAGITAATGFIDLGATTPILALMLGLAVGIDYALFIMSRYREELAAGRAPDDAAGVAVGTAGSSVLFAGLTVVIALAGLSVVGIGLLAEMGLAAAATVVIAVLVALTLLPALLGFAGPRVLDRRRAPRADGPSRPGLGGRWAALVTRRPRATLALAVLALGVVTSPVAALRLGFPDHGTYPEETTQRQAYDAIAEGFGPGHNGPLLVVVDAAGSPDPRGAADAVRRALAATPGVVDAAPAQFNEAGDTAVLGVIPAGGPDSARTTELVETIRADVRPVADRAGAGMAVSGGTAVLIDFNDRMRDALVLYLPIVIGLSFLLLMAVFRSVIVPLKATLGFLLSLGATFGTLVAIFQWGWLEPIGVPPTGTVISTLPILIIGVVFGLAMDYEVFLVTRMREEYVHGTPAVRAVRAGFRHGARVVAAAAVIMVSVFGGFVLGDSSDIIQMGVALATAVAVDAFVVRMTLVPAVLALFGDRAWWLPGWLGRLLPDLDVEGRRLERIAGPPAGPPPDGERGADPVPAPAGDR